MGIWEQLGLDMARHRMVALVGNQTNLQNLFKYEIGSSVNKYHLHKLTYF